MQIENINPMPAGTPSAPPQRRRLPFGRGTTLLFAAVALPAGTFYLRVAESYAFGTTLFMLLLLSLRWWSPAHQRTVRAVRIDRAAVFSACICVFVLLHLLCAAATQPMDFPRALQSLVLLFPLLLSSASFAEMLRSIPNRHFGRGMRNLIGIMLVVALIGVTGWGPRPVNGEEWRRPFFPFAEPAGFALPFIPLYIYMCAIARGRQRFGALLLGVFCMALLQTLTLAVGVFLGAAICLRKRELPIFAVGLLLLLTQVDLAYYLERVDFTADNTTNLSNLVYMQGWQMLFEGLERSHLVGQGFQQLGVHGTEVAAAEAIRLLLRGEDLNVLDGGFLLAKLGSEFGVFGLIAAGLLLRMVWKSILALRRVASANHPRPANVDILAHAVVTAFFVHMFVRSGGYFTGEVLTFITAIWLLKSHRNGARRVRPVLDAAGEGAPR